MTTSADAAELTCVDVASWRGGGGGGMGMGPRLSTTWNTTDGCSSRFVFFLAFLALRDAADDDDDAAAPPTPPTLLVELAEDAAAAA